MNNKKDRFEYLKNYNILKFYLQYTRTGLSLNTITSRITWAGGSGYDKRAAVFYKLFVIFGFDLKVCESNFDLFYYSIAGANDFLKQNNINYRVVYTTEVTDRISFIELSKID